MTPTQAQIDAAAKEIRVMQGAVGHNLTPENLAYAALTASAQVEVPFLCPQCGARGYVKDGATTAAAQVGEPLKDAAMGMADEALKTAMLLIEARTELKTIKAATIERCAQVAEDFGKIIYPSDNAGEQFAAAIRKLKDAP